MTEINASAATPVKTGKSRILLFIPIFLIGGIILCLCASSVVVIGMTDRIRIESISMQPTLFPGDYAIVNKMAYTANNTPQRGDVIVFWYPPDPGQILYIKRIIGLPGDHVKIADGELYINGELMLEPYLKATTNRGGDWTVPAGKYFVLGDNRNNSSDSRLWGYVPLDNIIGRIVLVYLPLQHWAFLHQDISTASP